VTPYLGTDLQPNNIIPDPLGPPVAPGVRYTKYFDLGSVMRTAWVNFPFEGFRFVSDEYFPVPHPNNSVDSFAGQQDQGTTSSMLYVTEDYNQTARYGSMGQERNPTNIYPTLPPPPGPPYPNDNADPWVGNSTLRKTYGELGGYVFGVYYSPPLLPSTVVSPQCVAMASQFTYGVKPYYIEAVYLDNTSGPTTRLNIVFRMKYTPGTGNTPSGPFSMTNRDIFLVYPIN
jgi:hypothetical protein